MIKEKRAEEALWWQVGLKPLRAISPDKNNTNNVIIMMIEEMYDNDNNTILIIMVQQLRWYAKDCAVKNTKNSKKSL